MFENKGSSHLCQNIFCSSRIFFSPRRASSDITRGRMTCGVVWCENDALLLLRMSLHLLAPAVTESLVEQVVKNLVFIGTAMHYHPELCYEEEEVVISLEGGGGALTPPSTTTTNYDNMISPSPINIIIWIYIGHITRCT